MKSITCDMIEIVGGLIGGVLILIGIIVIFAAGLFVNHYSFIQILTIYQTNIMGVAIGGFLFAAGTIGASKLMREN